MYLNSINPLCSPIEISKSSAILLFAFLEDINKYCTSKYEGCMTGGTRDRDVIV